MENTIEVRFESDTVLRKDENLHYTRLLNRNLTAVKDDIIAYHGYLTVIFTKGIETAITFESDSIELNKRVNLKVATMLGNQNGH